MTRLGRRAFLASTLAAASSEALGRTPVGGKLRLALPFDVAELDPHSLFAPLSALFGPAVADPLYAIDGSGKPYPTLAASLPEPSADGTKARVVLRPGLVTAAGKRLDAKDVVFSLDRAKKAGGAAMLAELEKPMLDAKDPLALVLPTRDPSKLAAALASPVTAIVPRGFSPISPDGTGAFRATLGRDELVLERNVNAARGGAFLERIEVRKAQGLADALRAFESDRADVGWLGSGLHRPRAGSVAFEAPDPGWVVLRTGTDARAWGAPGIAEQLLAQTPLDRLRPLGVSPPARRFTKGASWGGGAADLLVADESPALGEIADALAALLSQTAHPVRARRVPGADLAARRSDKRYALLLDFVRSVGPSGVATELALRAAVDPGLAVRPPQLASYEPAEIARGLPLGVVGALRVAGARLADCRALETWQLGGVFRTP
jgi:peptide/nickel transport system substrate-binding protein